MKQNRLKEKSNAPVDPRGWIVVQQARNGRGLFAARPFRTGQLIMTIVGKIVTADEVWGYFDIDENMGNNCYRYDADNYLNPDGDICVFANHSCNPNTGIVKRGRTLLFKAIAPIAVGTELTHDYSTLLGADDVWTMRCNCGEQACRSTVRNIAKLPKATLARYRKLGIVPKFILDTR